MKTPETSESPRGLFIISPETLNGLHNLLLRAMGENGVDAIKVAEQMVTRAEAIQPTIRTLFIWMCQIVDLNEKIRDGKLIANTDGLLLKPEIEIPTKVPFPESFFWQAKLLLVVLLKELMGLTSQSSQPEKTMGHTSSEGQKKSHDVVQLSSSEVTKFISPVDVFYLLIETLLIFSLDKMEIIEALSVIGITESQVVEFFGVELNEIINEVVMSRSEPNMLMHASSMIIAGKILGIDPQYFSPELLELLESIVAP